MDAINDTYLADILHDIAQGLLGPVMLFIIVMIAVTLFLVGQVIVEYFTVRRLFRQNMAAIVNGFADASYDELGALIRKSRLLRLQKAALLVVQKNMGLPAEPLFALAQLQIEKTEKLYAHRLAWTDVIAKVAPLLGLMGTLIPLGPGIVALGQNDPTTLSQSLLVAFDATVCGLLCAIVALVLSKVRGGWYQEYVESLEALMTCLIDKAQQARAEGVELPHDYTKDPLAEFKSADRKKKAAAGLAAPRKKETAGTGATMAVAAGEEACNGIV